MRLFLTVLCGLILTVGYGQDSLVHIKDLRYFSPYEKRVMQDFFKHRQPGYFSLFTATGNLLTEANIEQRQKAFNTYVERFTTEKFNSQKNDKKAKYIYDEVHATYFQKYELKSRFKE